MTTELQTTLNAFFGYRLRKPRAYPKSNTWAIFPDGHEERIAWKQVDQRYRADHGDASYSASSIKQIKGDMQTFEPGVRFEVRK